MRKKGSITDLPFIISGIFLIAITAVCVSLIVSKTNNQVQVMDIMPDEAKTASASMSNDFTNTVDGGIIFLFFGMCIVSFILASMVYVHPAFFIFYILEVLILIWVGAGIANAYQMFIENPVITAELSGKYVLLTQFFRFFPFVIGLISFALAAIMYKTRSQ